MSAGIICQSRRTEIVPLSNIPIATAPWSSGGVPDKAASVVGSVTGCRVQHVRATRTVAQTTDVWRKRRHWWMHCSSLLGSCCVSYQL